MSFGSKLSEARKAQNLTQEQLSERLGVTRQAVSRWESDAAYPETDKIVRMAQILNVSCDYLLQDGASPAPGGETASPVTRLLRDAVGKRVRLSLYDEEDELASLGGYDWCVIQTFDGGWADVELFHKKKGSLGRHLIPLSNVCSITFLKEG